MAKVVAKYKMDTSNNTIELYLPEDSDGATALNDAIGVETTTATVDGVSYTGFKFVDQVVVNEGIADQLITTAKIANLAISNEKIKDNIINAQKLLSTANGDTPDITDDNLAANAITVGTAAIASGAIANAMIANAAITNLKVDDAAINNAKISDLAANKITAGTIGASLIMGDTFTVNSSGSIYSDGKTTYSSTTAGFFLGYDSTAYKLNIGDATNFMKWDGAELLVSGTIGGVTAGDNEELATDRQWLQTQSLTYTQVDVSPLTADEFRVARSGTYRVKFQLRVSNSASDTAYGRIYRDTGSGHAAYGTERSTTSTTLTTYSEDLAFDAGDKVTLFGKLGSLNDGLNFCQIEDISFYCENPIVLTANGTY